MVINQQTEERLKSVYPDLAVRWRRVAADLWSIHRVQIKITDGMRSFGEQWAIWGLGRKKEKNGKWIIVDPSKIRTHAMPGLSFHNYGLAIDSAFSGPDPYLEKLSYKDRNFLWGEYGRFVIAHGMRWGGDWNGNGRVDSKDWDKPHCELSYGMSIHEAQSLWEYNGLKSVWSKIDRIIENGGL